jgi:hypothetical protein
MALLTFSAVAAGGKSRTARTWRVVANVVAAAGVGLSLWLDPPWAAALTAVVAIGAVIAVILAAHGDYAYVTAKLDDETSVDSGAERRVSRESVLGDVRRVHWPRTTRCIRDHCV